MLRTSQRDGDVDLERDRALVERCQQGDQRAFEDLYRRYRDRLNRYCCRRLNNPTEAEDAVQEAFARAWKAIPTFGGDRRFYPWLSVIANNVCVDIRRKSSRCSPVDETDLDAMAPAVMGGQEALVDETGERDILSKALGNLSDRHREVLELREGRNWSYQQIASFSGVEVSTIETLLFRARRSLRQEFMTLARAEGALGVALLPLYFLRRCLKRSALAAKSAVAAAGTLVPAGAGGAAGGTIAAVATTAVVVAAATLGAVTLHHPPSGAPALAGARGTLASPGISGSASGPGTSSAQGGIGGPDGIGSRTGPAGARAGGARTVGARSGSGAGSGYGAGPASGGSKVGPFVRGSGSLGGSAEAALTSAADRLLHSAGSLLGGGSPVTGVKEIVKKIVPKLPKVPVTVPTTNPPITVPPTTIPKITIPSTTLPPTTIPPVTVPSTIIPKL